MKYSLRSVVIIFEAIPHCQMRSSAAAPTANQKKYTLKVWMKKKGQHTWRLVPAFGYSQAPSHVWEATTALMANGCFCVMAFHFPFLYVRAHLFWMRPYFFPKTLSHNNVEMNVWNMPFILWVLSPPFIHVPRRLFHHQRRKNYFKGMWLKCIKIDLLQTPTKSKSILKDPMVCLSVDSEQRISHIDGKMCPHSYLQCIIMFNLGLMSAPCEQTISRRGQSHFPWHFDFLCFLGPFFFFTASAKIDHTAYDFSILLQCY